MDFIYWWFDTHPIWSTLLTAPMTLAWCIFKGEVIRGVIAAFICGCKLFGYS